jgi:hypothetical protein
MAVKPGVLGIDEHRRQFPGDLLQGPVLPAQALFQRNDLHKPAVPVIEAGAAGPFPKGPEIPIGGKAQQQTAE